MFVKKSELETLLHLKTENKTSLEIWFCFPFSWAWKKCHLEEVALPKACQIAKIASDFKMDVINGYRAKRFDE